MWGAAIFIIWLLSVEEDGPELALIKPQDVSPQYDLGQIPLDGHLQATLRVRPGAQLETFAIVTLPENLKQMSMNLRTPVLINPQQQRGLELPQPGLAKRPVRCLIYRELIASRPEDKPGMLVVKRKENETIEIGDEITVQVMEFADGGVRLGITAPRSMPVSRGESLVTPRCETRRADESMNIKRLEGIMKMHRVMQSSGSELAESATEKEEQVAG